MQLPLQVEFNLTTQMLRQADRALLDAGAYDAHFRRSVKRRLLHRLAFAPVWFFAVLGAWWVIFGGIPSPDRGGFAFAAIVAAVVPVLLLVTEAQLLTSRERMFREMSRNRARGIACTGRIGVEFTETHLRYQDTWTRSEFAWSIVVSFAVLRDYLVLTTLSQRMIVIPIAALPQGVIPAQLADDLAGLHEAAGGADQAVLEHLREVSHKCGGCGYDMKGAAKLECSECGRRFTMQDLEA